MKSAKRSVPRPLATKPATLRSLAARREPPAATLREGQVSSVDDRGQVRGLLAGGEGVEALCPAHIDQNWLRQACARAPIDAAFAVARPSGRYVLWGLFPGPAHADVRADVLLRGRHVRIDAESVDLATTRGGQLKMDADGNATLRGRDLTSHARRVNRIKGGSIRLN